MADLKIPYKAALEEFQKLTNKSATLAKNKGKEEGVKKVLTLFKSGKTLDQRVDDFDLAVGESERGGNKVDPKKAIVDVVTAFTKLDEGLKKNIADYAKQEKELGPDDKELKAGCGVLVNRLEALRKQAKGTMEARRAALTAQMNKGGAEPTADAKLKAEIRIVYLNMSKGIAESQAMMKSFMAKPSEDKIEGTFGSATGPRSIGAAVTHWKQRVLKVDPSLNAKLGADPEHLIKKIWEMTQRKPPDFWKQRFGAPAAGWENKAKAEAKACLDQMALWQMMADRIKALSK